MNMAAKRTHKHLGLAMAAWIAASGLMASEYHGVVRSGGLPFPGVTVTAIREGKKIVTTTKEQGAFSFADLADGVWAIQAETFGFGRIVREVGVASGAPAGVWELQYQSQEAILASLRPAPEAPAMEPGPRPEDAPGRNPASACGRTGGDEPDPSERKSAGRGPDGPAGSQLSASGRERIGQRLGDRQCRRTDHRKHRRSQPERKQFLHRAGQHEQRPGNRSAERLGYGPAGRAGDDGHGRSRNERAGLRGSECSRHDRPD